MKISTQQKAAIKKMAKRFGLSLVLLFGSQTSGSTHRESDIDIAIKKERGEITNDEYSQVLRCLCRIFKTNESRIDISLLNRANPTLLFHAARDGQVLFAKPHFFTAFQVYAINYYLDTKKLRDLTPIYLKQPL